MELAVNHNIFELHRHTVNYLNELSLQPMIRWLCAEASSPRQRSPAGLQLLRIETCHPERYRIPTSSGSSLRRRECSQRSELINGLIALTDGVRYKTST